MKSIVWISEIDSSFSEIAGPKVAKLGELAMAGLAVPVGFALTADVYREAMALPGIAEEVSARLSNAKLDDSASVAAASASVREFISELPIPIHIEAELVAAYTKLCEITEKPNLSTAVRSSATGEDSSDASFAGQFDSYLGVSGPADIVESVRACWASLFTDRGVTYRLQRGIDHTDCPMAVGVMELIDAHSSGIAFSIHPVTGRQDRIIIEGSWGWGEAIVQGLVVPDRAEVGKSDKRVLEYSVSHKLVMSGFDASTGRVVERPVPELLRDMQVLSEPQVVAIAKAVDRIERHFGHPVDVEWVITETPSGDFKLTIVQARPETVHGGDLDQPSNPKWDPAGYALKYAFGQKEPQ